MHVDVSISAWVAVCWVLTGLAWLWAFMRPVRRNGSIFDFSGLERLEYCKTALIVTLAVWLVYFAVMGWWSCDVGPS